MKARVVNNCAKEKEDLVENIFSNLKKEGYNNYNKIDVILCTMKERMIEKNFISKLGNNEKHKKLVREKLIYCLNEELNLILEQDFNNKIKQGIGATEIFGMMKQPNYLKKSSLTIIETSTDEYLNKQVNQIIDRYIDTKKTELNIIYKKENNNEMIKTDISNDKINRNLINLNDEQKRVSTDESTFEKAVRKYTNNYNELYSSDNLFNSGFAGIRRSNKFEKTEDYFKLQDLKNKLQKFDKNKSELRKINLILKYNKNISKEEKQILNNRKNAIIHKEDCER